MSTANSRSLRENVPPAPASGARHQLQVYWSTGAGREALLTSEYGTGRPTLSTIIFSSYVLKVRNECVQRAFLDEF